MVSRREPDVFGPEDRPRHDAGREFEISYEARPPGPPSGAEAVVGRGLYVQTCDSGLWRQRVDLLVRQIANRAAFPYDNFPLP